MHPSLPPRIVLGLGALGGLYCVAGIASAVRAETTYDAGGANVWELPVLALDLVFLALILAHHTRTSAAL